VRHTRLDIRTTKTRGRAARTNAAAIASLVVAGAAFAWTVYRDIALRRALAREAAERKAGDARDEEPRREASIIPEETSLPTQEVADVEDRRAHREVRLVGLSTGASFGLGGGVDFPVSVQNEGGIPAQDVAVWLSLDEPGVPPENARPLTQAHSFAVVMPGTPPLPFSLRQTGPFYGAREERDGLIVASWRDGSGDHVEKIGRLTVFQ
jgi:hypothetical protein